MKIKYFVLYFLFYTGYITAQFNEPSHHNDSLSINLKNRTFLIKYYKENIVMLNGDFTKNSKESIPIIAAPDINEVSPDYNNDEDKINFNTHKIKICIDKQNINIFDEKGLILCWNLQCADKDSLVFNVSGNDFYGISNHRLGNLTVNNGDTILAGEQGHAGAPFIWTTRGYGILFDSDGGNIRLKNGKLEFLKKSTSAKIKVFIFTGSPYDIMSALTYLTGKPPLFPKWALGFMNSEWGIDQEELLRHINTYRKKNIPIDAFIMDFDWMDWGEDEYGEFRWGKKFPDGPSGILKNITDSLGVKLMGIRKPRIHLETIQGKFAEENKFFIGYQKDYFSKKQVGLLNFYKPEVRKWYWESFALRNNTYKNGIIGYWNDEADAYGGNFMFTYMQKAQYDGQREMNNIRVFSLNRNFYLGNQKYAYCLWSGDIDSGFAVMAEQRLYMLSSIALGAAWWSMDIGGFHHNPTNEEYYRWMQFGAFVPVFRVHGSFNKQREPWFYNKEAEEIAKKYIRIRYELIPYIYSYAWENHNDGVSICRPLIFNYPKDTNVRNLSSEFLFGDNLLISPIVTENKNQILTVYLPEGDWYNYWTNKKYTGNQNINYYASQKDIPIFVKSGSIIPANNVGAFIDDSISSKTLILNCYNGADGKFDLYNDDGLTYDYERGKYCIIKLSQKILPARQLLISRPEGDYPPKFKDIHIRFLQVYVKPNLVLLSGNKLPESLDSNDFNGKWFFDVESHILKLTFPYDFREKEIILK